VVTALIGTTLRQSKDNGMNLYASGFSSDQQMADIGAATTITPGLITNSVYRYNAGFGRLNYNWQDKYLMNLSGRRDGSSKFGPASQFHDFYAIGRGWLFAKEDFVQNHFPVLSYGKLRMSYGTSGNDQVGDHSYLDLYSIIPYVAVPYQGANGIAPATLYNPTLAWEETRKSEGGLELGFFKDKIIIKSSYFLHVSSNLLIPYPLSDITGFNEIERNLNAVVKNYGWEFEWQSTNIRSRNFRWSTSFNLSITRNVLSSGPPNLSPLLERNIGHSLYSGFLYHCLGVNPITGMYQFADRHRNATDNPDPAADQISLVDPAKKYYGGIQNTLHYRGIQLDFLFQFVRQPQVLNHLYSGIPGSFSGGASNQPVNVLSRWSKPGDVSKIERFSQNGSLASIYYNTIYSDLEYGDGSFIRLRNIALSWQFPKRWMGKAHLQSASVFAHAENVLLFTKFKGLNPETPTASAQLPPLRVVTVGAKLNI